ncbi:MAG: tetratricopeptide repeat protein [Methanobacteriaceae archaeon]|nr:tetratricopeptide repeat protein [Methanobacteriaceae archaeon]MDZ4170794.1 tetratricopeptide repeat protein [Methanobacteriaceae archaeon]
MDPLHAETWYDKGVILKEIKEYSESIQCFKKALKLKPGHEKALKTKKVLKFIDD